MSTSSGSMIFIFTLYFLVFLLFCISMVMAKKMRSKITPVFRFA